AAFVAVGRDGSVLLERRPAKGILAGMTGVPTSNWAAGCDGDTGIDAAPFCADWRPAGSVRHVFTHFALELAVFRADRVAFQQTGSFRWSAPEMLVAEALPTLFRKVIQRALAA